MRRGRLRIETVAGAMLAALFAASAASADLSVVFVIDTTGSMSGELREVKERVEQIAEAISAARSGERLRFGVVAYRDRRDAYVTRLDPLTSDLDATRSFLGSLTADGGGDGPEDVLAGLREAIEGMGWGDEERRVILIGDAPPHLDYADDPTPAELIRVARERRVVVDAIGCRSLPRRGVAFFQRVAYATEGSYQHIAAVHAPEGGLTEAVTRAVARRAPDAARSGREIGLVPLGRSPGDGVFRVLLRRQGVAGSGDGQGDAGGCLLEVSLPDGVGVAEPPLVVLAPGRVLVRLVLGAGAGGVERFALDECPPAGAVVGVEIGGAS